MYVLVPGTLQPTGNSSAGSFSLRGTVWTKVHPEWLRVSKGDIKS